MSKAGSFSLKLVVILAAAGAAASGQACGSDEDGSGGSGASGATDGTGATGNTGNTGGAGNTGNTSSGGGAPENVDCPADPGTDACQVCAQDNCAAEVMACCEQDAMASAEGKLGCYDVVACAREAACSGMDCLTACEEVITAATAAVALTYAQPLGDCVTGAVDMGLCPDCMAATGGAGGGG